MQRRNLLLAVAGGLVVACGGGKDPEGPGLVVGPGNALTAGGTVVGVTPAPDSQYVGLAGAKVTLVFVGPIPTPPPGVDTLRTRSGLFHPAVMDSVVPPEPPPPPPAACPEGTTVASAVTDATGQWTVTGLEEGLYNVQVAPPAEGGWNGTEYCGYVIQPGVTTPFTIYLLPAGTGT